MNATNCLAWCHEYCAQVHDERTARNVIEIVAPNARTVAQDRGDHLAIDLALTNAHLALATAAQREGA